MTNQRGKARRAFLRFFQQRFQLPGWAGDERAFDLPRHG
jgi:hypothetical protein